MQFFTNEALQLQKHCCGAQRAGRQIHSRIGSAPVLGFFVCTGSQGKKPNPQGRWVYHVLTFFKLDWVLWKMYAFVVPSPLYQDQAERRKRKWTKNNTNRAIAGNAGHGISSQPPLLPNYNQFLYHTPSQTAPNHCPGTSQLSSFHLLRGSVHIYPYLVICLSFKHNHFYFLLLQVLYSALGLLQNKPKLWGQGAYFQNIHLH